MSKDQELIEKIAKWCAISCNSDLPYQFHAKEIISLCRQHFRNATLDEVKELAEHEKVGANENDGEGDRYYDKALTDLIKAIDNLRGERGE